MEQGKLSAICQHNCCSTTSTPASASSRISTGAFDELRDDDDNEDACHEEEEDEVKTNYPMKRPTRPFHTTPIEDEQEKETEMTVNDVPLPPPGDFVPRSRKGSRKICVMLMCNCTQHEDLRKPSYAQQANEQEKETDSAESGRPG